MFPGYIDLSKRRVSAEEVVKCEEQYEKGRAVDSILTQVAKRRNVSTESLYEQIAWPLHSKYGHSYEAFKLSIQEPEAVFGSLGIDADTLVELKHTIARRLTPKPVKVRADIEVKCFDYQGIEAIRRALKAGEALSTEEVPIKVRLVAPPLYVMSTTSTDKTAAIDTMEKAVAAITASIEKEKGDVVVKMAVSVLCWPLMKRICLHPRSPRLSRRPTTPSSRLSWSSSSRPTWTLRATTTRRRRTRRRARLVWVHVEHWVHQTRCIDVVEVQLFFFREAAPRTSEQLRLWLGRREQQPFCEIYYALSSVC